jgi:Protein of unknown function (DUF3551)
MRLAIFVLGILVLAVATPASAQNYPWCATYGGSGSSNCGFSTQAQCQAAVSGTGGFCNQNNLYQTTTAAPRVAAHPAQPAPHKALVAPQPE